MTKSKDDSEQESAPLTAEVQKGKEIEEISPEIVEEVLSAIPENKRQMVVNVFMNLFSNPIPPPEKLEYYERIAPGAANRMITMAEKEQGIRDRTNTGLRENDRLRIFNSTFTSAFLILGALVCASIDQVVIGVVLGSSGVIAMLKQQFTRFGKRRDSNK